MDSIRTHCHGAWSKPHPLSAPKLRTSSFHPPPFPSPFPTASPTPTHGKRPQGYYDDNLDFIRIERIQIVGTMTPPGSVGRHALSTRFTALTRIMNITTPDKENLITIYTSMASKVG